MWRLFLLGGLLFSTVVCVSQINPAILLNHPTSELPWCVGFAGEDAMVVTDSVCHLVYLGKQNTDNYCIVYVKLHTQTGIVLQREIFETAVSEHMLSIPTIAVSPTDIKIIYERNGTGFITIQTFNIDSENWVAQNTFIAANNSAPLIKHHNGEWSVLTSKSDNYADSLGYFVDYFCSSNDTPTFFEGSDILYSPVRSNSDIWIRQVANGSNNGWPTFYAPVYTSGMIMSYGSTPPYSQIFRSGYFEHVKPLEIDNSAIHWQINHNSITVGPENYDPNRILFVTVVGNVFTSFIGNIVVAGVDTADVWASYPPRSGAYLFRNRWTTLDTIWTEGPSGIVQPDRIMYVNSPLWIRGNFGGKHTWYANDTIKLVDDITLMNTPIGASPSNNQTDYVALIANGNIEIQYGHKDPINNQRYKPNCGSDADGIFIYASLFAIKDGQGNPHQDGVFTFEYQHPHPSVPDCRLGTNNYVWNKIDLHRRRYPQTGIQPWPSNIDYPWYNPLWPEANPTMERGTIHLFGSVLQRRRGFIHRNRSDTDYPNPNNIWDIPLDYCGGPSGTSVFDVILGVLMQPSNALGATGNGVGYKLLYGVDNRLNLNTFPINPYGLGIGLKSVDENNWLWKYYKSLNEPCYSQSLCITDTDTIIQYNNHILYQSSIDSLFYEYNLNLLQNEKIEKVKSSGWHNATAQVFNDNPIGQDSLKIINFNLLQPLNQAQCFSTPVFSKVNTFFLVDNGIPRPVCLLSNGLINIYYWTGDNNGQNLAYYTWDPQIPDLLSTNIDLEKSKITVINSREISSNQYFINILLYIAFNDTNQGKLFYASGLFIEVPNHDEIEIPNIVIMKVYPNPFSTNVNIKINTSNPLISDISIFNIKGQKIRQIANKLMLKKGENYFLWNGKDDWDKHVAHGIYFVQSYVGEKKRIHKILYLK